MMMKNGQYEMVWNKLCSTYHVLLNGATVAAIMGESIRDYLL